MHLPEAKISAANCVLPELSTEEQHVCGKTCGTNHHLLCYLLHSRDCLCQHAYVFLAVGQLCLCVHWNKILKTKRTDVLKIYCYFSESNKDGMGGGGEEVHESMCACMHVCVCVHVCVCMCVHAYECMKKCKNTMHKVLCVLQYMCTYVHVLCFVILLVSFMQSQGKLLCYS